MIPENNKIYEIDCWTTNPKDQEMAYKGLARCTSDGPVGETPYGEILYYFELLNKNCQGERAEFAEEDIVREVKTPTE